MLTFKEWLNEAAFRFLKAKDQDYTNHPYDVLVFSEETPDTYEVEGKTHGQMSHAIKHLKEFEPDFVKDVIKRVRKTIIDKLKEKPHWFCRIWSNTKGFSTLEGVSAVNFASDDIILNTLDCINDKNQMGERLLKLDSSIRPFAVELEKKYNEIISEKLDKSVNLNKTTQKADALVKKMKKSQVIQFDCKGRSGGNYTVALDFSDQSLIIGKHVDGTMKNVTTMYRFRNTGTSRPAVVDAFFDKKFVPHNEEIRLALSRL